MVMPHQRLNREHPSIVVVCWRESSLSKIDALCFTMAPSTGPQRAHRPTDRARRQMSSSVGSTPPFASANRGTSNTWLATVVGNPAPDGLTRARPGAIRASGLPGPRKVAISPNSARATRTGLPSPVGTGIGLIRACQQNPLPLRVTWHGDGDWDATDRLEGTHATGGTGL